MGVSTGFLLLVVALGSVILASTSALNLPLGLTLSLPHSVHDLTHGLGSTACLVGEVLDSRGVTLADNSVSVLLSISLAPWP